MLTRTRHGHSAGFTRKGRSNSPRGLSRDQRRRIEELVEHFLALLDADDGDADLEPSLGWSRAYATSPADTSPASADLEEDEAEGEPWAEAASH